MSLSRQFFLVEIRHVDRDDQIGVLLLAAFQTVFNPVGYERKPALLED